jgi:hypothetical protein
VAGSEDWGTLVAKLSFCVSIHSSHRSPRLEKGEELTVESHNMSAPEGKVREFRARRRERVRDDVVYGLLLCVNVCVCRPPVCVVCVVLCLSSNADDAQPDLSDPDFQGFLTKRSTCYKWDWYCLSPSLSWLCLTCGVFVW